jgi:hypothetical protein
MRQLTQFASHRRAEHQARRLRAQLEAQTTHAQ